MKRLLIAVLILLASAVAYAQFAPPQSTGCITVVNQGPYTLELRPAQTPGGPRPIPFRVQPQSVLTIGCQVFEQ